MPGAVEDEDKKSSGVIDPPVTSEESETVEGLLTMWDDTPAGDEDITLEDLGADPAAQTEVQDEATADPAATEQIASPPASNTPQPTEDVVHVQGQPPQTPPASSAPDPAQATPPAPVGEQGATQTPSVVPGQELEALRAALESNRERMVEAASAAYEASFSDEDVEAFQSTDPKEVKASLAKMAARLHADVAQNVLGMVASRMPQVVQGLVAAQATHKALEDQFYGEYPELKVHGPAVMQIAAHVRHLNPQATYEQLAPKIAAVARIQLGVQPSAQPGAKAPPKAVPKKPAGFQPIGGGVPAQQPAPVDNNNPWASISEILGADEEGHFDG